MPKTDKPPKRDAAAAQLDAISVERVSGMSAKDMSDLTKLWITTIIMPELTKDLPMLYGDGANSMAANYQCTFDKYNPDWPQTGPIAYPDSHRLGSLSAGINHIITDQSGQPLQLLNMITDEGIQQAIYESKNSLGLDAAYSWTSPGGGSNFIIPCTASNKSASAGAAPQAPHPIVPWNAIYDPTVPTTLMNTKFMSSNLATPPVWSLKPAGVTATPPTVAIHDFALPSGKANGSRYIHIDACTQATGMSPVVASIIAGSWAIAAQTSASCIIISTGDQIPGETGNLSPWYVGDQVTCEVNEFNENCEDDPVYIFQFLADIAAGGLTTPGQIQIPPNTVLAILPVFATDDYRLNVGIVADGTSSTLSQSGKRSLKISHTSCGGFMAHKMAPDINDPFTLGLFTATRVDATSFNAKNYTTLAGRGAKACVYQMPPGSYWQEAFGQDSGNPMNKMSSQPDEIDETFILGERMYLPPVGSDRMNWRMNIDNPTGRVPVPSRYLSLGAFNLNYELIGRNIIAQCLLSPGVSSQTTTGGATNVVVTQQQAQAVETVRWCRFDTQTTRQILARRFPKGNRSVYDAACTRVAHMKKCGPSAADIDYFIASEGYRDRMQDSLRLLM